MLIIRGGGGLFSHRYQFGGGGGIFFIRNTFSLQDGSFLDFCLLQLLIPQNFVILKKSCLGFMIQVLFG